MDTRSLYRDTRTGAVFKPDASGKIRGDGFLPVKQLLKKFGKTEGGTGQKSKGDE
jgi:hypothetical protein